MARINPLKWSTKKIDDLLVSINQTGKIPRYSPFFNNDSSLLAADINFGYTQEEFIDRSKIQQDIFYFAINYCHIKQDEGYLKIKQLRPYQKNLLYHLVAYNRNVITASRQIGKAITYNSKIKTNTGVVSIGDLYFKHRSSTLDKIKIKLYAVLAGLETFAYQKS